MKRSVLLTEGELINVIKRIILEQSGNAIKDLQNFLNTKKYNLKADGELGPRTNAALEDYLSKNPNEANNPVISAALSFYKSGKIKGIQAGTAIRSAISGAIKKGAEIRKKTIEGAVQIGITVGKLVLTCVIFGVVVLVKIGQGFYKIGKSVFDALLRFLNAVGNAVVSAAKALDAATTRALNAIGVVLTAGVEALERGLNTIKDGTVYVITSVLNAFKEFGISVWGKVLIAATKIKEFGTKVLEWIKTQYKTIEQKVGVAWDQAVSTVKSAAKSAWNTAQDYAGRAVGFGQGLLGLQEFLQEFFVRYRSTSGYNTKEIILEMRINNGRTILY